MLDLQKTPRSLFGIFSGFLNRILVGLLLNLACLSSFAAEALHCDSIRPESLRVGDLIFSEVDNFLYRRVARASGGWTSHVGIIHQGAQKNWVVYESRPPLSARTPFCDFIKRNSAGRIALSRINESNRIGQLEEKRIQDGAEKRLKKRYDLWFNYDSTKTTFCSKFVDVIFRESLGLPVGKIEPLETLFKNIEGGAGASGDLRFWKAWFLGSIPWKQRTLSPQSQFDDPNFHVWFDSKNRIH
jgi:hypothetical protein